MTRVPHPISARAADLLAGLSWPNRLPAHEGAFSTPQGFPRLSREIAVKTQPWPGAHNAYLANGDLQDPAQAYKGQNFYTGVALGHDLVRAFLLGLLCQLPSDEASRGRLYDTACALADGDLQKMQRQIAELQQIVSNASSTSTTIINNALPRAIIDTNGAPGDVVRWNLSNHLEVATGTDLEDQDTVVGLLGAAATAGQEIEYYPSGSRTPPIPGAVRGRVYRHRDGSAKNRVALVVDDFSLQVGIANGDGRIDVVIDGQDFIVAPDNA